MDGRERREVEGGRRERESGRKIGRWRGIGKEER